jgi:hypothetical protein
MSVDAIAARPETDYSYSCDYATGLSKGVKIAECSGQVPTYEYSLNLRSRSQNSTMATKDGFKRWPGSKTRTRIFVNSDRRGTARAGRSALRI